MSVRFKVSLAMMVVLTLFAICGKVEPTETSALSTVTPTSTPTEAPSPTPPPMPTSSPPDIVGLWKDYPLDGEKSEARQLIGISQKADGGLEMMVVTLDITTRA